MKNEGQFFEGINVSFDLLNAFQKGELYGEKVFLDFHVTRYLLLLKFSRFAHSAHQAPEFYSWCTSLVDELPEIEASHVYNSIAPQLVTIGAYDEAMTMIAIAGARKLKTDSAYFLSIYMAPYAENTLEELGQAPWVRAVAALRSAGVDFSVAYDDEGQTVASFLGSYELENDEDPEEILAYRSLVQTFAKETDLTPGLAVNNLNPIFADLVSSFV